jgi:hypothetical protein
MPNSADEVGPRGRLLMDVTLRVGRMAQLNQIVLSIHSDQSETLFYL